MRINKINTYTDYQNLIKRYVSIKQYTNDYIQVEAADLIVHERLYECHTSSNLFLLVEKELVNNEKGYRVYYYLGDLEEIADFSDNSNWVVEILYRGDRFYPQAEIDYLCKCGFAINLIRDLYCGMYKDLQSSVKIEGISVVNAQNKREVDMACKLFNASFDVLSGDYIPELWYDTLFANGQILIAKDENDHFLGALHQTIDKGVAWISHVAVMPEARGKHVGQALLNAFVENNYTTEKQRYMFWVQQKNEVAVNMYMKKGFKYLNKSTISLIK